MHHRDTPWRLPVLLALIGCQPGVVQLDHSRPLQDEAVEQDVDSGALEEALPATEGEWSGEVLGFAAFEEDWDADPYCGGAVSGLVGADGQLTLSGDCTILWGPHEGTVLRAEIAGRIHSSGTVEAMASLDGDERWFNESLLIGSSRTTSLEASAKTFYSPAGIDPVDAEVSLTAERR